MAGLLFGAGYVKGKSAGEKAALRSALTASQEQTKIANKGAQTLTSIANEKDDSSTNSAIDNWLQHKQPWK